MYNITGNSCYEHASKSEKIFLHVIVHAPQNRIEFACVTPAHCLTREQEKSVHHH